MGDDSRVLLQEKKSLYASPGEFQSLIKQVLSWDIRSLSQRNRPHDTLLKKENDELLGNTSDVDEHQNETPLVHEREQNALNSNEVIYHLILEGLDVSYRIDHDGNVIVENISTAVQDSKPNFCNYLTWKDKMHVGSKDEWKKTRTVFSGDKKNAKIILSIGRVELAPTVSSNSKFQRGGEPRGLPQRRRKESSGCREKVRARKKMGSPSTTGETKKIAVRSSIVDSFRGCGLSGIRIDKEELKKQLTMPQYLRYAMRDSIRHKDPAAGESRYIKRAEGEDSAAPPCPMVVFINPRSGGRHVPALKERLQQLMSEEQVFDLSDVKPHEFVRYGLGCLEMLAGLGDSCAKETRERIRVMVAGGDGTVGWVLGCLTELRAHVREPVPPVGIIPLGTGNDLSRSFNW
ncbi:unnamed protein product, partial [Sphenostylis stenocarpa]